MLPPVFIICIQAYLTLLFSFIGYMFKHGLTGLFSMDPVVGVLGFISSNYLMLSFIVIGPIC